MVLDTSKRNFEEVGRFDNELPSRNKTVRLFVQFVYQGVEDIVKVFTALGFNIIEGVVSFHKVSDNCHLIAFKTVELKKMCLELKEQFLTFVDGEAFVVQDVERQYEFVTPIGAPHEMTNKLLSKFGVVKQIWRGRHKFEPLRGIENGFRHAYISLNQNATLPAHLRFGSHIVRIRANSNQNICQKCNQEGHLNINCTEIVCFNCDKVSHRAVECPSVRMCILCRGHTHSAKVCSFNWNLASGDKTENVASLTEKKKTVAKEIKDSNVAESTADQSCESESVSYHSRGYSADNDDSDIEVESEIETENEKNESETKIEQSSMNESVLDEINVKPLTEFVKESSKEAVEEAGKPKRPLSDVELPTEPRNINWADEEYVTYADKVSSSRKKSKNAVYSPVCQTD